MRDRKVHATTLTARPKTAPVRKRKEVDVGVPESVPMSICIGRKGMGTN